MPDMLIRITYSGKLKTEQIKTTMKDLLSIINGVESHHIADLNQVRNQINAKRKNLEEQLEGLYGALADWEEPKPDETDDKVD